LETHNKSKPHKRRLKEVQTQPFNHEQLYFRIDNVGKKNKRKSLVEEAQTTTNSTPIQPPNSNIELLAPPSLNLKTISPIKIPILTVQTNEAST